MQVLQDVEKQWTRPTGVRRVVQGTLVVLANWTPPFALLAALINLLNRYFDPFSLYKNAPDIGWVHVFLPFIIVLAVLMILQLLIVLLLPMRWGAIRDEFHRKLETYVRHQLESVYLAVPGDLAKDLNQERQRVEHLIGEVREVADWLEAREQHASIAGLYGN
jgi:hypothetical protein